MGSFLPPTAGASTLSRLSPTQPIRFLFAYPNISQRRSTTSEMGGLSRGYLLADLAICVTDRESREPSPASPARRQSFHQVGAAFSRCARPIPLLRSQSANPAKAA